ncbi:hypothetical protein ACU5P1_12245 [Pseudomonas plecoglossicida]|nr:hypothetical protein [Pseudomonas plecoglossicida]EPB97338.1 hypothetical protein L321_03686 [Pseudomonas plecoglossicida NB2011]
MFRSWRITLCVVVPLALVTVLLLLPALAAWLVKPEEPRHN